MSEVKLILRDATRTRAGTIHGACADRFVAALAADPVTLEELDVAIERFEKRDVGRSFFGWFAGSDAEPWDAGLVVIDLAAKLVVVDSTYSSPGKEDAVSFHDGNSATDVWCRYRLADDWLVRSETDHWQHLADRRRAQFATQPTLDARAIFYGRPLLEFLATACFQEFARRDDILREVHVKWIARKREWIARYADDPQSQPDPSTLTLEELTWKAAPDQEHCASPFYDTLKDIHANWLMTPRDDLSGKTPREILLADRDHLMWDMQYRCEQWSRLNQCPRGLDESSQAFRFGGFGTHELVEYYELVRHLMWSCWRQLTDHPPAPFSTNGDFFMTEVERLEVVRDEWLDSLAEDLSLPRTPREIIRSERRRLPEGMSGREAMHDADCPCCQMLADMPGPSFWHLDGCNMDDEFAFSIYERTREQWDAKQREYAEMDRLFEARRKAEQELGVTYKDRDTNPLWSSSYSGSDSSDNEVSIPIGIRVFGIGCHLAEIIADLRLANAPQATIDALNRHFGNLREVLGQTAEASNTSLIEPVTACFITVLQDLEAPDDRFLRKTRDLANKLEALLAPPPPESDLPPFDASSFDDFPF